MSENHKQIWPGDWFLFKCISNLSECNVLSLDPLCALHGTCSRLLCPVMLHLDIQAVSCSVKSQPQHVFKCMKFTSGIPLSESPTALCFISVLIVRKISPSFLKKIFLLLLGWIGSLGLISSFFKLALPLQVCLWLGSFKVLLFTVCSLLTVARRGYFIFMIF